MVIIETCAWCGGPHATVINCEKGGMEPHEATAKAVAILRGR